jgi:hypothetical protein
MIQIARVDQASVCPELASVRKQEFERVRDDLAEGTTLSENLLGKEYRIAKLALYAMQHYKCCYCESIQNTHLWNGGGALPTQGRGRAARAENPRLLVVDMDVGTSFPLVNGSTPLATFALPPGSEEPLLLDPSDDEDPRAHIQFRPVTDSWWPFPRNGSLRGLETLKALRLYHPEFGRVRAGLLSKWRQHAAALVPVISRVRAALDSEAEDRIRSTWEAEVIPRLFTNQEFVALSIDVFDDAFDAALRAQWGLVLEPIRLSSEARRPNRARD